MIEVLVTGASQPLEIGASGLREIVQNVKVILTTAKGSVPLDREFGLDMRFLDQPVDRAKAMLMADMVAAVQRDEPRVQVLEVTVHEGDAAEGHLVPAVRIAVDEKYL